MLWCSTETIWSSVIHSLQCSWHKTDKDWHFRSTENRCDNRIMSNTWIKSIILSHLKYHLKSCLIPVVNAQGYSYRVCETVFPPIQRNPEYHQSPKMWSKLRPLFASPSFHCKERNHWVFAVPKNIPHPSQQQAGAHRQPHFKSNHNCVFVCLHFFLPLCDMKKKSKWVSVSSASECLVLRLLYTQLTCLNKWR